ncbi:MAG: aminotransferase class I/II-fold pyridoxal phosphate-dependent enzyme [Acidimicrobiales bacterium]
MLHNAIAGRTRAEIAVSVESAARAGRLPSGQRLPPIRELAEDLDVSPGTVAAAIATLRQRGVVVTGGRRGTFIASRTTLPTVAYDTVPTGVRDLAAGNPDPELLPRLPALKRLLKWPTLYGEPADDPELVASFRSEFESDGIDASWLTVVGGAMDGVERVLAAHLGPGDTVAVEDPGHAFVHDLIAAMGLRHKPLAVDDSGPVPASLQVALDGGVDALVLTPRAQNPLGAALDDERVAELTRILDDHPVVLILEDDHAAHVAGAPARTLTGGRRRWAVVRSVSKVLGPDLRLAALAGDETTIGRVVGRRLVGTGWVSHVLQRLTVAIRHDPTTAPLLDRAERTYEQRRNSLLDALATHDIPAHGRSGLSVWVPVRRELPVVQALREAGWAVIPGERFRLDAPPGIRITTAALEPNDATRLADALATILTSQPRSRTP